MQQAGRNYPQPILVTGMHRSGTSWVGKMIAASDQLAYISEPLNIYHRAGVLRVPTYYWYTYIHQENEEKFWPALQDTIHFNYHILKEIPSLHSVKDILRMVRDGSNFLGGRLFKKRALIKDPFAVFSAPWFADKLNCQVVITVRHPAAVASSLKRLNWSFDFNHLLEQNELMSNWLEPFRDEIEGMIAEPQDIIAQAGLLWNAIYHVVAKFQRTQSKFQIVRHEDLSLDPAQEFRRLYKNLGLSFTKRVEKTILNASSEENPKQLSSQNIHSIRLDSQANLKNWKKRLDRKEIRRIYQMTEETAKHFYSEADWQ